MTTLYRLEFGIARDKGEKEIHKVTTRLVEQMQKLTELARKHNIAVIVTNQVYQWEDESKMVGGDILRYWGRCLIELKNEGGKRTARLVKHRSLPESTLNFQIYNKGIKKKGWI
ncbi:hypothetical protein D6817_03360 [Candidatus Pacearchaeota archaeon]|nr:MAG: hypothetical protein D6817_03360 [Candidatus Pacearchaeota archaeon]